MIMARKKSYLEANTSKTVMTTAVNNLFLNIMDKPPIKKQTNDDIITKSKADVVTVTK